MLKYHHSNIGIIGIAVSAIPIFLFFCSATGAVEIPSSFNPVGSGARAIGTGGAFIAVADDATAASWNPGGLPQLRKPELSVVTSGFHRREDSDFGTDPEASGANHVWETNINYLSAAWPFELFNRNMILSLSYQHLFDFSREWDFILTGIFGPISYRDAFHYEQNGSLSAVGISYGIQIIPEHLSAGITLNFWEDSITDNEWEQRYSQKGFAFQTANPQAQYFDDYQRIEKYAFSGFNMNAGLLWDINDCWRIGAVLKTPFTADIAYSRKDFYPEVSATSVQNNKLKMPVSYGVGIAGRLTDRLSFSGDFYRTHWDDFEYMHEDGGRESPLTGKSMAETETEPTLQVRIGLEYLLHKHEKKGIAVPLRLGAFYDPAPAEKKPDDFYGFSIGAGFTWNNRFSLDMAYQYRFGSNVQGYTLTDMDFSQDVQEHMFYLSVIAYSF